MARTDAEWISHFNAALSGVTAAVGVGVPACTITRNAEVIADAAAELIEKRRQFEAQRIGQQDIS